MNTPSKIGLSKSSLSFGDTRRPTASEVLNGKIPGRKESEAPPEEHRAEGFDRSALFHVPAPGIHPRVFFGPEDIPRLRGELANSPFAREVRSRSEQLWNPGSFESEAMEALASGEVSAFQSVLRDERNPYRSGPPGGGSDPFPIQLQDAAFFSLIDGDENRGRKVARAAATYFRHLKPLAEKAAHNPGAEHYWLSLRGVMGDGPTAALLYDFCWPFLGAEDREAMRSLLAFALGGRYGLGMDLPRHFRNWNFIGMGLYFPLMMISLEGEIGYDARVVERGAEVARDYILYGNSALGTGKEAVGYHTSGMLHTAEYLLALANRGKNNFTLTRWREVFSNWLLWTLEPWGGQWLSSGDLGNFPPNRVLVCMMRRLFPSDPQIEMIWKNLEPGRPIDYRLGVHLMGLLFSGELPRKKNRNHASAYEPDPQTPLRPAREQLSQFDPERGILWARTGWTPEDASFQFAARNDAAFPSHDFADRGAFYFSALGMPWAVSGMRETESKYHSVVTVDGRGQGYFAPPATWLSQIDSPLGSFGSVDLKYCWDWFWMKSCFLSEPEQFEREPWLSPFRTSRDRLLERFPLKGWEWDPHPNTRAYYEGFMSGDPRMWGHEDSWVVRYKHFPVDYAFRTAGLVRGKHSYAAIFDDMRVDGNEHLYQWRMTLPPDLEAYQIMGNDIVLGRRASRVQEEYLPDRPWHERGAPIPEIGQPLLLVKTLEARHDPLPTFRENPSVETIEIRKHADEHQFSGRSMGLAKRLVIPSRSSVPSYKIFLIPYRHGETLPEISFHPEGSATFVWPDQIDDWRFECGKDGRTRFELRRGEEKLGIS